jgi:hypothetical protein
MGVCRIAIVLLHLNSYTIAVLESFALRLDQLYVVFTNHIRVLRMYPVLPLDAYTLFRQMPWSV